MGWIDTKLLRPQTGKIVIARWRESPSFLARFDGAFWHTLSGIALERTIPTQWKHGLPSERSALENKIEMRRT